MSAIPAQVRADREQQILIAREMLARKSEVWRQYKPYPKQMEFHAQGAQFAQRCLMAGNQCGKTFAGAMEVFYHLTGLYPEWWPGLRFEKPPVIWIGGDTGETIRDTTQRLLLDRPGRLQEPDYYRGIVPPRLLADTPKPALGTPNLLDHFQTKHSTGGVSYCYFKAYAKGRQKFQGETIDLFYPDEEPPQDIYSEGLTRTNNGQHGQCAMLTFTPLLGISDIVYSFLNAPTEDQIVTRMTIEDAEHYTPEERRQIIASYPAHEREARAKGVPIMGSGAIFPVSDDSITEDPIDVSSLPGWWLRIGGLDFGWDHPTAAVYMLYDPEMDTFHVHRTHRQSEVIPEVFVAACRPWKNIPMAWPHDGLQHDKGSGDKLAALYKQAGFNMLPERATFDDGTNGVEAGVMDMLDRMESGRFKVSRLLTEWFEEKHLYHRKDGKIVKVRDDLLSATRYAMMMVRFAEPLRKANKRRRAGGWRTA